MKEKAVLPEDTLGYIRRRPVGGKDWLSSRSEEKNNESDGKCRIGKSEAVALEHLLL